MLNIEFTRNLYIFTMLVTENVRTNSIPITSVSEMPVMSVVVSIYF